MAKKVGSMQWHFPDKRFGSQSAPVNKHRKFVQKSFFPPYGSQSLQLAYSSTTKRPTTVQIKYLLVGEGRSRSTLSTPKMENG